MNNPFYFLKMTSPKSPTNLLPFGFDLRVVPETEVKALGRSLAIIPLLRTFSESLFRLYPWLPFSLLKSLEVSLDNFTTGLEDDVTEVFWSISRVVALALYSDARVGGDPPLPPITDSPLLDLLKPLPEWASIREMIMEQSTSLEKVLKDGGGEFKKRLGGMTMEARKPFLGVLALTQLLNSTTVLNLTTSFTTGALSGDKIRSALLVSPKSQLVGGVGQACGSLQLCEEILDVGLLGVLGKFPALRVGVLRIMSREPEGAVTNTLIHINAELQGGEGFSFFSFPRGGLTLSNISSCFLYVSPLNP